MSILILFDFVLWKSVRSYMHLHFDFPQVVSPLKLGHTRIKNHQYLFYFVMMARTYTEVVSKIYAFTNL